MSVDDYLFALKIHKQLNEASSPKSNKSPVKSLARNPPTSSIVDPEWETTDPNPDIHSLFGVFNNKFFWKALGAVEVKWSPRMYTCAGICTYKGRGGCIITLSLPLLKFRPRKDLVETLLHEMIHAYLFVTKNNKDRGSHGPEFCKHKNRINEEAGTNITIYHSFHDEVDHYRTHVWRCNGSCRANPPYFGYVRRATNRAPGPNDFWFAQHLKQCGGTFSKVGEPENFKAKPRKKESQGSSGPPKKKPLIDSNQKVLNNFFPKTSNVQRKSASPVGPHNKIESRGPTRNSLPTSQTLAAPIHGVKPNTDQGGSVVKHGGVKNNIHGFGKLDNSAGDRAGSNTQSESNFKAPIVPFAGKGYVLGSGTNDKSKSKLLGGIASSPTSNQNQENPSTSSNSAKYLEDLSGIDFEDDFGYTLSSQNDSDDESDTSPQQICPVCNGVIKRGISVNEHLDDCDQLEQVFNSSKNYSLSDSESDDEYSPPSVSPIGSPTRASPDTLVDCPNCSAKMDASAINEHLDQCLSFD